MSALAYFASRFWSTPASPEEGEGLGCIVNSRGARLQTKTWPAVGTPRALVVFCHGYSTDATHNRAWDRVGALLSANLMTCIGFDYMGHGHSEGPRLQVESFALLVDDLLMLVDEVRSGFPGLPVFLRGQSMGGLLAIAAALRRPTLFRGLALGAPAFELGWTTYLSLQVGGRILRTVPMQILTCASDVKKELGKLQVPIAVFQGVEDSTVHPAGARRLINAVGSADKALFVYQAMGHNMSIEPDVLDWIISRIELQPLEASLLHVRRPSAGVVWNQPPPGSSDANINTEVFTVTDIEEQNRILDELFL